mgnify:CR=1 FL=1
MKNNLIKGIPASPGIAIGKAFLYKENNLEIDLKNIKTFIDFIVKDVLREERRFLEDNAITDKRISKIVGSECANWFKRAIRKGEF